MTETVLYLSLAGCGNSNKGLELLSCFASVTARLRLEKPSSENILAQISSNIPSLLPLNLP